MAVFNYITINGTSILAPNDLTPTREPIYAAEITTMTGKTIADVIGWKYADMTLKWDTLPQDQLEALLNLSGECTITFVDVDGSITEKFIPLQTVQVKTRHTLHGLTLWRDVSLDIRFTEVHAS